MGWITMPLTSMGAPPTAKSYLDAQFTYENTGGDGIRRGLRVIASSCPRNRTYYAAAVPSTDGVDEPAFAIVCAVRWNPRGKEGYVFGYKDMMESMGPCEDECPERILAMLGETSSPEALMWRKRCTDNLRRAARKLEDGMHIRFDRPVRFSDGYEGQDFIVHKRGRTFALARQGDTRPSYRVTGLTRRPWTEVARTRVHKTAFAPAQGALE